MEFIRNYLYWIIGGVVLVGGVATTTLAFMYESVPDGETEFIISPLDERDDAIADTFPSNFENPNFSAYDWTQNFPTEFQKIPPPTGNPRPSVPPPTSPPPAVTPWAQGPSVPPPISRPSALPSPGGTPWTTGPSNQ